jgi:RNase P protein component
MNDVEEFLEHHGVKGQKWGIRNKSKRTSAVTSREHKRIKKNRKAVAAPKPSAKSLSSQELQAAVSRMNLEKQYNQLIGNKKQKSKLVSDFISSVASTTLKTAATAVAAHHVSQAMKKHGLLPGK